MNILLNQNFIPNVQRRFIMKLIAPAIDIETKAANI
jgi:hypothetical protein